MAILTKGQGFEGNTHLSFADPFTLIECGRNYFNNQIINIADSLWKHKTSQVGGKASQVGGIACIFKVNKRNLEPSGMAVIRLRWR